MGALGSIAASRIAREFHLGGPSFTISSEETSGLHALAAAVRALQRGELDAALVGAVDLAGDVRAVLADCATTVSVVGEGAAAFVLKRLRRRRARRRHDPRRHPRRRRRLAPTTTAIRLQAACREAGVDPAASSWICRRRRGHRPHRSGRGLAALVKAMPALAPADPAADARAVPPGTGCAIAIDGPRRAGGRLRRASTAAAFMSCWRSGNLRRADRPDRLQPLGAPRRALFVVEGRDVRRAAARTGATARAGWTAWIAASRRTRGPGSATIPDRRTSRWPSPCRPATAPNCCAQIDSGAPAGLHERRPAARPSATASSISPQPLGRAGKIAFVYPGSGNDFPGMGRELAVQWPDVLRRQDARERASAQPVRRRDAFWGEAPTGPPTRAQKIFAQVALGSLVTDVCATFGVRPDAAIGYSLGESAACSRCGPGPTATRCWRR